MLFIMEIINILAGYQFVILSTKLEHLKLIKMSLKIKINLSGI